ncbi:MAG: hypothetical protein H7831_04080 [Magnetococcus sp. WYHC-3]
MSALPDGGVGPGREDYLAAYGDGFDAGVLDTCDISGERQVTALFEQVVVLAAEASEFNRLLPRLLRGAARSWVRREARALEHFADGNYRRFFLADMWEFLHSPRARGLH